MYAHHEEAIQRLVAQFQTVAEVDAVLLGGSIAHGFALPGSDIDLLIVVSDQEYDDRLRDGRLQFFDNTVCSYEGGYAEGKYMGPMMLQRLALAGSEPARFAFMDARVLLSRVGWLDEVLAAIARYPVEHKADRLRRFYAQFEAWHWYAHEGLKLHDPYLLNLAVAKLVLFGGRLILAHNEVLFPYHKWFLRVLERTAHKPAGLLECIAALQRRPSAETIGAFYQVVADFRAWEVPDVGWANQFMLDSELNWLTGAVAIDDL